MIKIELTVDTTEHGQTEHVALQVRCNGTTQSKNENEFVKGILAHIDAYNPAELGGNQTYKLVDSQRTKDN